MEDLKKVDETIPRKQICYGHKRWGGHMDVVVDYQKELSGEIEKDVGGWSPLTRNMVRDNKGVWSKVATEWTVYLS
jgi:hypothetical protein